MKAEFVVVRNNVSRVRKRILWESDKASEQELSKKEVEFIRKYRSNDPTVGYNQWPKLKV